MEHLDNNTNREAEPLDAFTEFILRTVQRNLRRVKEENRRRWVFKSIKPVFHNEIRCMMYAFGDAKRPLAQSVLLIEKILREQMNLLLERAAQVSSSSAGNSLTHESLLLLLGENIIKLKRLLLYLNTKDAYHCISKKRNDYTAQELVESLENGKRVKMCLKFLRQVNAEKYGSITLIPGDDPLSLERNKRRYLMQCDMGDYEYLEFSKKLQVSFSSKECFGKFKDWLTADKVTHLKPTSFALEIICYLARETVAEVVETTLLIKKETKERLGSSEHSMDASCSWSKNTAAEELAGDAPTSQINIPSMLAPSSISCSYSNHERNSKSSVTPWSNYMHNQNHEETYDSTSDSSGDELMKEQLEMSTTASISSHKDSDKIEKSEANNLTEYSYHEKLMATMFQNGGLQIPATSSDDPITANNIMDAIDRLFSEKEKHGCIQKRKRRKKPRLICI